MEQPIWVTDEYGRISDVVNGWGVEILAEKMFGDHQGDIAYILRNHDGQFGLSVLGYGSCLGCDAFMYLCNNAHKSGDWTEVVEYSMILLDNVYWKDSKEELMAWVNESADNGYNWWSYDDEAIEWLNSHGAKVETSHY